MTVAPVPLCILMSQHAKTHTKSFHICMRVYTLTHAPTQRERECEREAHSCALCVTNQLHQYFSCPLQSTVPFILRLSPVRVGKSLHLIKMLTINTPHNTGPLHMSTSECTKHSESYRRRTSFNPVSCIGLPQCQVLYFVPIINHGTYHRIRVAQLMACTFTEI